MTQEEKQLLLKDLCARLPYGLCIRVDDAEEYDLMESVTHRCISVYNGERKYTDKISTYNLDYHIVKPYLRPMSSMTEEEKEELKELIDSEEVDEKGVYFLEGGTLEDYLSEFSYKLCNIINDWLNAHHFDYRGLIEKGLALPAPEKMYKFD